MTTIRLSPPTGALRIVNEEGARLGLRGPSTAVVLTPVGRAGVGVPPAGATGALLVKDSASDYDTSWLATTAYGRAALAWADAAAGRTALGVYSAAQVDAGFQPLDADLTAIAALATTAYGRSLLTPANAAAGRTLLELGASDSPTFAGLTVAGLSKVIGEVGLGATGYPGSVGFSGTTTTHYTGDGTGWTWRVGYRSGGATTTLLSIDDAYRYWSILGSAPGTAGAGEVRIGGGQINAAGLITTAQYFVSAANSSGSPTAFNASNAEAGNYLTAVVNGSVASGVASWVKASLIESVGVNAGEGSLVLGSYRGEIKFQVGARTTNALTIAATGAATFYTTTAPGTAGTNEVRIGAGQINAAGSATFGGQVLCAGLESSGVAQAFACKGSSGTYGTFFHSGTAIGDIGTANQVVAGGSSADIALTSRSGDLILGAGTNPLAKVPASSAADEIALYLYDQTAGTLKRVTRGAADSGGTGYRLLRVAN